MASLELESPTDLRQSPGWAKFMSALGWQTDRLGETYIYSKKIPLLGTIIRIPRPRLPLPLEETDQLARDRGAFLVKVEPNLLSDGFKPKIMGIFRKDSSPILPTKTIWIDLNAPTETLLANFDKDARNLVRRAEKEGVVVVESKDLENFYELWSFNARDKKFFVPFAKEMKSLWKSFDEKHLLVAKYKGEVTAAALLFGYQKTLYYSFAASSDQGRSVHAPYLLFWEVISRGKGWGYQKLDLEGVEDAKVGRTKRWHGFSEFKRQFGGQEVEYVGSFSKYYSFLGRLFGRFI